MKMKNRKEKIFVVCFMISLVFIFLLITTNIIRNEKPKISRIGSAKFPVLFYKVKVVCDPPTYKLLKITGNYSERLKEKTRIRNHLISRCTDESQI